MKRTYLVRERKKKICQHSTLQLKSVNCHSASHTIFNVSFQRLGREFSVTHKTNHQLSFPHGASIQKPLLRTTICQPAGSIIGMLKLEASGCLALIYSSSCQYLPKLQKRSLRSVSIAISPAPLITVMVHHGLDGQYRPLSSP